MHASTSLPRLDEFAQRGLGAIEYVLVLNGPTISDQSEYRAIWAELITALNSFPAVAAPAELGPLR